MERTTSNFTEKMKANRHSGHTVAVLLAAYLITGVLSPKTLLGESLFTKLDQSLSGQSTHSIVLDERPFWTSHKHLESSDRWFEQHAVLTSGLWSPVFNLELFLTPLDREIHPDLPCFPTAALRAPPKS